MKPKKRYSIKDIAKELNVSVTTVSFVLNGKGKEKKISTEVIAKVFDYANSVNYRPNLVAQSLRTGKTKILVFMVEDIGNYFFSKIARIIEDIAYAKGYKVIFCSNDNDDEKSKEMIALFSERQVDGFIIIPSPGIQEEIKILSESKTPLILFDRYFPEIDTNYVVVNNYEACYTAAAHLVENGFKNIAFITTDVKQIQMLDRLAGYKSALDEKSLKHTVLKIPFEQASSKKGKNIMSRFFQENLNLDSVVFATNYLAQNGMEMLKEEGVRTIEELGIVSFDDNDFFKINTPTITAIAQPLDEIGKELTRAMFHLLKKNNIKSSKTVLKAELVIRQSSMPKS